MPATQTDFVPGDTLLVLDLLTGAWVGQWRSRQFRQRYFAPFYDGDEPRIACLGAEGGVAAMFPPGGAPDDAGVPIVMEARAVVSNDLRQSRASELTAEMESIGARYRVSYSADGVGEKGTLRDRQPDAEASRKFGGSVDLSNAADTLSDPYREDYSMIIPEMGAWLHEDTGWTLGARQRVHESVRIPRRSRATTIAVTGDKGRVAVRALAVGTRPAELGRGSKV